MAEVTAMLVSEQRRNPQLSYKNDIIFLSGIDDGDKRALEKHYKNNDPPCQVDPEDDRFVMKGPRFNPLTVINLLAKERGYKIAYNPQQRGIPLKPGSTDDKFAMIYFLTKPLPQAQDVTTETECGGSNPPDIVSTEQ